MKMCNNFEIPSCSASGCLKYNSSYSKTCRSRPLKKNTKIGFQYRMSLNAGQKYWRMLQEERYAILLTFMELLFSTKTFVLSIFKWPL